MHSSALPFLDTLPGAQPPALAPRCGEAAEWSIYDECDVVVNGMLSPDAVPCVVRCDTQMVANFVFELLRVRLRERVLAECGGSA